jgi:hypothetical protein
MSLLRSLADTRDENLRLTPQAKLFRPSGAGVTDRVSAAQDLNLTVRFPKNEVETRRNLA